MIVVDASAILEILLQSSAAAQVSRRVFSPGETLHAPHLIDVEIAHALRRFALLGTISADRGEQALAYLAQFPLSRYPHLVLLPRIWQLRGNVTAYDAAYLALAEVLDAPLVTRDRALATACRGIRVEVL